MWDSMSTNSIVRKPLDFIGSSRNDLRKFPKEVRIAMGTALNSAQLGGKHPAAKPLKGFGGGEFWRSSTISMERRIGRSIR
jgi:phage-related protein